MTAIQIIVSAVSIVGMLIFAYFDLKHEFKWIREVTGADMRGKADE